jgi:hypothetical protein
LVAEAVVNLDGTGTWSIGDTTEPITATSAAAACDKVGRRAVVAAAERETEIELTATIVGVETLLRVSPTGEITRFEVVGNALHPASSPGGDPDSETVTDRHVPLSWAELADLSYAEAVPPPSSPPPSGRVLSGRGSTAVTKARRPRWTVAAAAVGALAAATVAGLVLVRGAEDGSPSASAPATHATVPTPAVSPPTYTVVPAAAWRKLDVTLTARKGGPLTAQVRATAAPTVATLTIWSEGRRIATRRLHLTGAQATWSSGTVTFAHTGPGHYRWAATAPGAARVTGTYDVPVRPEPRDRRVPRSTSPGTVGVAPSPAPAPAATASESPAPATLPSSTPPPSPPPSSSPPPSTPPPPSPTKPPEHHNGPVPGGNTGPPHNGPRP